MTTATTVTHTFERSDLKEVLSPRHEIVGAGTRLEFDATQIRRIRRLEKWIMRRAVRTFAGAKRVYLFPVRFDYWRDAGRMSTFVRVSVDAASADPREWR